MLEAFIPNAAAVSYLADVDGKFLLYVFDFLTETVQGPCFKNQEFVVCFDCCIAHVLK